MGFYENLRQKGTRPFFEPGSLLFLKRLETVFVCHPDFYASRICGFRLRFNVTLTHWSDEDRTKIPIFLTQCFVVGIKRLFLFPAEFYFSHMREQ